MDQLLGTLPQALSLSDNDGGFAISQAPADLGTVGTGRKGQCVCTP